jgi:DNA-binding transcriptional MerR regulator
MIDISELAARTGSAPSALRFYERRKLLKPSGRAGGRRTYDESAVVQVALIDLLKQAGYTLNEIAQMVDASGRVDRDWRNLARTKLKELEAQIAFARRAKTLIEHSIACPHPTPDRCPVFRRHLAAHVKALASRSG